MHPPFGDKLIDGVWWTGTGNRHCLSKCLWKATDLAFGKTLVNLLLNSFKCTREYSLDEISLRWVHSWLKAIFKMWSSAFTVKQDIFIKYDLLKSIVLYSFINKWSKENLCHLWKQHQTGWVTGASENKTRMEKIFVHWSNTLKYRQGQKGVVQTPVRKSELTTL